MNWWNQNRRDVPRSAVHYLSAQKGVSGVVSCPAGRPAHAAPDAFWEASRTGRRAAAASSLGWVAPLVVPSPPPPAWCAWWRLQGMAWDEVLCDWYRAKEDNDPTDNWAYGEGPPGQAKPGRALGQLRPPGDGGTRCG